MQIDDSKRPRSALKTYFAKNAIPTEQQFAQLIDSGLNQRDDGIVKAAGDPLSIEAAGDASSVQRVVNFYGSLADTNPAWAIALKPRADPANPATARAGWSVLDTNGAASLTIDALTGNIGMGTIEPKDKLEVTGRVRAGSMMVGPWPANANYAAIGATTLDQAQPGNYALLQGAGGDVGVTYLNSPSAVHVRINNVDRMLVTDPGIVVTGSLQVSGSFVPSAGNSESAGINFPPDPGGGGGDRAWLRYFPRAGESMTLELGTSNDPDDHISLMPSGSVGIGTRAPVNKLDVAGDIALQGKHALRGADGWLRLNQDGAFTSGVHTPGLLGPAALNVGGADNWANPGTGSIISAGNITCLGNLGIGTRTPVNKLDVAGDIALQGKHALRGSDGWLRLNQDGAFPSGVHTPGLFAPLSLNVGGVGGWVDPGKGNITCAGTIRCAGSFVPSAGDGEGAGINFPPDPGGGGGDRAWMRYFTRGGESMTLEIGTANDGDDHISLMPSGNVGIGTRTPVNKLDVAGDIAIQGKHALRGNDAALRINQDNAFPAGTIVDGRITMSNMIQFSSGALKEDIRPMSGSEAGAIIAGRDPVAFRWRNQDAAACLGFIAEDSPDAVTTPEHDGIYVSHIVAALTRVVRDQTETIETLERRLGSLEAARLQ